MNGASLFSRRTHESDFSFIARNNYRFVSNVFVYLYFLEKALEDLGYICIRSESIGSERKGGIRVKGFQSLDYSKKKNEQNWERELGKTTK